MIPKKLKPGKRTVGLLYYLYGPGRADEHLDPHLVAAWAMGVRDPARDPGVTMAYLAALLDAPVLALRERRQAVQHVYHLGVRVAPQDRVLSDEEWAEIAREMVDAAGLAPGGDPRGARWVAVRHAEDHIHIVATMARQDGKVPNVRQDMVKMQSRARQLEIWYGLRRLVSGDRTAQQWPHRAELERAEKADRTVPARTELAALVRRAAASATSREEFFTALRAAGVRLKVRTGHDGTVTGYAVALPGDRTAARAAVWYGGARLAPDLSMPRVQERWAGRESVAAAGLAAGPVDRARTWQEAAGHVLAAASVLGQGGVPAAAGEMIALSDLMTVLGADAPVYARAQLREAARAFERAGRAPTSRTTDTPTLHEIRAATTLLVRAGRAGALGADAAVFVVLLTAVLLLIAAAACWHQRQGHLMQQEGAALAGQHLRAAVEMTCGAASLTGRRTVAVHGWAGHQPAPAALLAAEQVVRQVLPGHVERILREAGWPVLVAALEAVRGTGADLSAMLAGVASYRPLADVDSVSDVLVWRLGRHLHTQVTAALPDGSPARPPAVERQAGGGTGAAQRCGSDADAPTLEEVVRRVVPEYAEAIQADPAAGALAAVLGQARSGGHDAVGVLTRAGAWRSLDDADSVAQVLTWRLRGLLRQQAAPVVGSRRAGDTLPAAAVAEIAVRGATAGQAAGHAVWEEDEDAVLGDGHGHGHSR